MLKTPHAFIYLLPTSPLFDVSHLSHLSTHISPPPSCPKVNVMYENDEVYTVRYLLSPRLLAPTMDRLAGWPDHSNSHVIHALADGMDIFGNPLCPGPNGRLKP